MGLELTGPDPDEVEGIARDLISLVDAEFSGDCWSFNVDASATAHRIYCVAALRHVTALLEGFLDAAKAGNEATLRVIGRAHIEAWMVAFYIVYFGEEALNELEAAYAHAIKVQHAQLKESDDRLRKQRKKAKKANKAVAARNERRREWNAAHPDLPPRALDELVAVPRRDPFDVDLASAVADFEASAEGPPLSVIAARLTQYGRENEGPDAVVDAIYDIAYRGLSTLGAHPTLWVLDSYIDWGPAGQFARTVPTMRAASMSDAVIGTATYATAMLAKEVLAFKGRDEGSRIVALAERWHVQEGPEPAVSKSDSPVSNSD